MPKKIRVGSRESKLAVLQSEIVINIIKNNCPDYEIELITMKTTGDKILDKTLDKVGGKGLFIKELDYALLEGDVDITVHSLKDVPMTIDERLPLSAFTKRASPYDVLVLPNGVSEIDFSKPVGSSSMRRGIQFKKLFPEAEIKSIRGNVITRLNKLDNGEYSALILAEAGLMRLGLEKRISRVFSAGEIVPAAGQGVIAIQTRKEDNFEFFKYINDADSEIRSKAERAFVKEFNGGCSSPIAAFAELIGDEIELIGFYAAGDISEVRKIRGNVKDAESLGVKLAYEIKRGF